MQTISKSGIMACEAKVVRATRSRAPQVDTLWFGRENMKKMCLLEASCLLDEKIRRTHGKLFLLCRTKRMGRILDRFGDEGSRAEFSFGENGIIMPTGSLGDNWLLGRELKDSDVREACMRIALLMRYDNNVYSYPELNGSERVMGALKLRAGNCYHINTLLAAVLRKNNVPARMVWYHGEILMGEAKHCWVEAFVEGKWREYDACFMNSGLFGLLHNQLSLTDFGAPLRDLSCPGVAGDILHHLETLRSRGDLPTTAEFLGTFIKGAYKTVELEVPK